MSCQAAHPSPLQTLTRTIFGHYLLGRLFGASSCKQLCKCSPSKVEQAALAWCCVLWGDCQEEPSNLNGERSLMHHHLSSFSCEILQTEVEPGQNWSLEMPHHGPSSGPQPQYWMKFLDPMGARFVSSIGLGFGNLLGRAQLLPLDKSRCPKTYQ